MARNIQIELTENQTGDEEGGKTKSDNFSLYSLMITTPLSQFIGLLNMVLQPVGSIPGSGSGRLPLQDVYSKSWTCKSCNLTF